MVAHKTSSGSTAFPSPYDSTASSSSSSWIESTATSASSIELLLHPSPTVLPLSTLSLLLPEPFGDGLFDADVARVRKELKGSDLRRKLAVLSEVWAREVASADVFFSCSEVDATDGAAEDRGGFDPHYQKRTKYRGGGGDCMHIVLNLDVVPLDADFEKLVNQCFQVAATFVGKSWTAEALVRFKLDYLSIEAKLNPITLSSCDEDDSDSCDELGKCEEASEMLYGDSMTMAAPEYLKELDSWIEDLEKTNTSQDELNLDLEDAR